MPNKYQIFIKGIKLRGGITPRNLIKKAIYTPEIIIIKSAAI